MIGQVFRASLLTPMTKCANPTTGFCRSDSACLPPKPGGNSNWKSASRFGKNRAPQQVSPPSVEGVFFREFPSRKRGLILRQGAFGIQKYRWAQSKRSMEQRAEREPVKSIVNGRYSPTEYAYPDLSVYEPYRVMAVCSVIVASATAGPSRRAIAFGGRLVGRPS